MTQSKGRQAGANKIEVTPAQLADATRVLEARLANADYAVGEEDVIAVLSALDVKVSGRKNAK